MDAMAFLTRPPKTLQPVYALIGEEDFLKRQCREAILAAALGGGDASLALAQYGGDKVDWSTVLSDLSTLPFLTPRRVVCVESADKFVSEHRGALEKYVVKPSPVGVLILEVKTFPETTKLAKALPDGAKLVCKAPYESRLASWCVEWSHSRHGKKLSADAAQLLVELVGPTLGLLDQELAKLATAVADAAIITAQEVDQFVGRSRSANVFRILDCVGEGKAAEALNTLAELFAAGEDPLAVLGALTAQLRRLAAVARALDQGLALGPAMDAAGVPNFPKARQACQNQLRHLGMRRLRLLTDWLVEVNLGLKGGNPLPPKLQLERLIVQLARPREPLASETS